MLAPTKPRHAGVPMPLMMPAAKVAATQGYGANDDNYRGSHHDYGYTYVDDTYALDFAQAGCESYGKEVTPMADGTVMAVYEGGGYGNNVMIDHGDGYVSRYAHMSDVLVSEGEDLKTSDTIGLVGNTGLSTKYHLHFELLENNKAIDPIAFLPIIK